MYASARWRVFIGTPARIGSSTSIQECIDCGACEPACPVEAIYHEYDIPTRWVPYIDVDALWFRDPEAAHRVAALKEGGKVPNHKTLRRTRKDSR